MEKCYADLPEQEANKRISKAQLAFPDVVVNYENCKTFT
jgi:hypothetical protein